jgi:hypothetical protein
MIQCCTDDPLPFPEPCACDRQIKVSVMDGASVGKGEILYLYAVATMDRFLQRL